MTLSNGRIAKVQGASVLHWNPRAALWNGRFASLSQWGPRRNNFGDLLGPSIAMRMVELEALRAGDRSQRLLTVGSILHFARDGDVVWGSGVNGKVPADLHRFQTLDVRAVRGPRTRAFLRDRGVDAPETFGDPALLLPNLFPSLVEDATVKKRSTLVVLNLNDALGGARVDGAEVLDPRGDMWDCVRRIVQSEYVVSTSLHGVIVAEAFGVPARLVLTPHEHRFKYEDYYLGTGRAEIHAADSVDAAIRRRANVPEPTWDPSALLAAFPRDIWSGARSERRADAVVEGALDE